MMLDLWAWISPFDTYQSAAAVASAAQRVHLPGFKPCGVLLPTLYDDWTQSQLTNSLGHDLKVASPSHAGQIRASIEALGVACGGWSVPRGTGDIAAEGYAHGRMAAQFEYFVLNFEDGWDGFWTQDGRAVVDLWIGAFWSGYADDRAAPGLPTDKPNVGVTMVTNSGMMQQVSDDEAAAWVGGTNFDALEAYIPGDAGLDPGNALRIWHDRLVRIGVADRPVVPIVEQGDLPALIGQYADPVRGAQIWTLSIAAAREWPAVEDEPDVPTDECDWGWQAKKDLVVTTAGELLAVADQIAAEANRKGGPRVVATRALAKAVRDRAKIILS